ncbi:MULTISPECIES: hypothetical protein [unclassified Xanthomonas]|uniref:hypothetical protein n=1 Tax=unclassified Xanthomonas TaxID=2643310 RepID=UPI0028833134|nr:MULTISPECIES: hypothetical protein [unclassified Xanthomonas]
MRDAAPEDKILGALQGTGFILEHETAQAFQKKKWSTISGRFYLDDVDGRARELDLIAYKVKSSQDLDVSTVILVSCKKDAKNTVAFLSRSRPKVDPNADWEPVHIWTKSEPLKSHLADGAWKDNYLNSNPKVKESILSPKRDIFAFQLVSENGTPQNDKPIFDSITSLMKAMDHEISQLNYKGKKNKRLYQFILCTIFDAPMVDAQFEYVPTKVVKLSRLIYFSRYIVNKIDSSALVHFVRADRTDKFIDDLDVLHKHNAEFFQAKVEDAYKAITTSKEIRKYFATRFSWDIRWKLNGRLRNLGRKGVHVSKIGISYYQEALRIEVDISENDAKLLDADLEAREELAEILLEKMRYKGPFTIEEDIPF